MPNIDVVTRFAPSPTGLLHIGGARTALFNWLFAKANGGRFLLRIEDTDRIRLNQDAEKSILDDLAWLGLDWHGAPIRQSTRQDRHREIANKLLRSGAAFRCYSSLDEVSQQREISGSGSPSFVSPWRDADAATYPDGPFAIRLRTPRSGRTTLKDKVYGEMSWPNESLDDLVILRMDGSPTYNLAATVDDHDSSISHVIRGDDHLANTAKQILIYSSLEWRIPVFAHVPLVHSESGRKLSKRDGAAGLEHYRKAGYHPGAVQNYLTRLGWSHGNEEFFDTENAINWFDLGGLRKSPARLDEKKLANLSRQHIAGDAAGSLVQHIAEFLQFRDESPLTSEAREALLRAMYCLKVGAKSLGEIIEKAQFLISDRPIEIDQASLRILKCHPPNLIPSLTNVLAAAIWERDELESTAREFAEQQAVGLGKIAQVIRLSLCGRKSSPSVFDMMILLGRVESLARLNDARYNCLNFEF